MNKFSTLCDDELVLIEGGLEPFTVAFGLGSLFLSAAAGGYVFGKDLANRQRRKK